MTLTQHTESIEPSAGHACIAEPEGKIAIGAIQAISGAATTMLALEVAFLGYWAFGSETVKTPRVLAHLLALVPMAVAFIYLTKVPLVVTALT